jgi:hypothetical protein
MGFELRPSPVPEMARTLALVVLLVLALYALEVIL